MAEPPAGVRLDERPPTVAEYQRLRGSTGWSSVTDDCYAAGADRALFSVCAVCEGEVVGCGRVVGDGGLYFYVQDVIVLPRHRHRGIGRAIMTAVIDYLRARARPGAFVGLMAAEGYAGFYERCGFRRRPNDAPGMYRVWGPTDP